MATTFVLIPGAGGQAWYWHRLVAELERRGHVALAVDLPADDDSAGLAAYAETVVPAIGDRTGIVLVAQSMGGLTAPLVCTRVPIELLVLVNAMVPLPGETGDRSRTRGRWPPGRTCRRGCSSEPTTGSSPRSSSDAWPPNGWVSRSRSCPADISWR